MTFRVNSPNLIFIGIVSTSLALGLRSSINLLAISLNGSNKVFRWLCYGHSIILNSQFKGHADAYQYKISAAT